MNGNDSNDADNVNGTNNVDPINVNNAIVDEDNCKNDTDKAIRMENNDSFKQNNTVNKSSYVTVVEGNKNIINRNLSYIPTHVTADGDEIVIFEEDLIQEGSKQWQTTVCGYFVGCQMPYSTIQYNLRRMWGRFGLGEILMDSNQICYFKFKNEEGMLQVIENSPWMVNGKPLVVQKWDPKMNVEKVEHKKIPVWAKLINVPLEAWSLKGISTLASRLGRPIVMDNMTASMCHKGVGRVGYARILVEVEVEKGFADTIEVHYKDRLMNTSGIKTVKVEYNWKPKICSHRMVFGHDIGTCNMRQKTEEEVNQQKTKEADEQIDMEGFKEVRYKKNGNKLNEKKIANKEGKRYENNQERKQQNSQRYEYRAIHESKTGDKGKQKASNSSPKMWQINKDIAEAFSRSANKYAVLSDDEEIEEVNLDQNSSDGDIIVEENDTAKGIIADEVEGRDSDLL